MKSLFCLFILTSSLFCADTTDIFLGFKDRSALREKRVSVSGFVNAAGCEKAPCKLMAYRWIGSTKVLFILNFDDRFTPFVSRKRVLDPIRVSCVMTSDFEYRECLF